MSEDGPADISMAFWPDVRAIEGAANVVGPLAERYKLAIVTNATVSKRPEIIRALERVGLAKFFSEIFCYTEIGRRKSEPEFWGFVLARLDAKADEALVVGDSLEQDVLGPMRCGIQAVWFNWKTPLAQIPPGCTAIHKLSDLPSALELERGE